MSPLNSSHPPVLIDLKANLIVDHWQFIADDQVINTEPMIISFARALAELPNLNGKYGVRIEPVDDVRFLLPYLEKIELIEIVFRSFRDGRGYSSARILRENMAYKATLRSIGDVLRDQLWHMIRCGFDEFYLKDTNPVEAIKAASDRFRTTYQNAADSRKASHLLRLEK